MEKRKTAEERARIFADLTPDQKQDIQIAVCRNIDEFNKIMAGNPLLTFYMQDDLAELLEHAKKMDSLVKLFNKFLRP